MNMQLNCSFKGISSSTVSSLAAAAVWLIVTVKLRFFFYQQITKSWNASYYLPFFFLLFCNVVLSGQFLMTSEPGRGIGGEAGCYMCTGAFPQGKQL